jgi:hypothetical protein
MPIHAWARRRCGASVIGSFILVCLYPPAHVQVDMLPEIVNAPTLQPELERLLPDPLKGHVNTFLKSRSA